MNELVSRVFYWLQWGIGALALAFIVFYFLYVESGDYAIHLGVGSLATAALIGPGIVISVVINQVLLVRRPAPRLVSATEGVLMAIELLLVALLVWQAFDQWSLASIPLTVLIVAVAITLTVLLNRRKANA